MIKIIVILVPYSIFFRARVCLFRTNIYNTQTSYITKLDCFDDRILSLIKQVFDAEDKLSPVLHPFQFRPKGVPFSDTRQMRWQRFHNLKNLKGWLKLTLIKFSYYVTVSVTFPNSLVNIPRTRDSLIQGWVQTGGILLAPTFPAPSPKKKRIDLVINWYEVRSMLFLFCASSA